ncbi:MAG: triple tyrosine motif-containing protein [Bacteroidota bacterium]
MHSRVPHLPFNCNMYFLSDNVLLFQIREWKSTFLVLFYSICFLGNSGFAQTFNYKHYTTADGLMSNNTYMCLQDKKGYIWICTDAGVNQFDGKYFRKFTSENGLADNDILKMIEDRSGKIWFLSYNGHMSFYSYEDQSMHNEMTDPYLRKTYLGSEYNFGFVDSRNRIWLGTMNGLCSMIDDTVVTIIPFEMDHPDIGICYSEDKEGNVFIFRGFSKYKYNEKTGSADALGPFSSARYGSYFLNKENDIVFYTDETLYEITLGEVKVIYDLREIELGKDDLSRVTKRSDGSLLACTNTDGAFEISKDSAIKKAHHLPGISVNSAFVDKENNMWFMSRKDGIYLLSQESRSVFTYFEKFKINALCNHKDFILASTESGKIFLFNENELRTIELPETPNGKCYVYNFLEFDTNEILLATSFGLMKLYRNSEKIFQLKKMNSFGQFRTVDLFLNKSKDLFVCSVYQPYIIRKFKHSVNESVEDLHKDLIGLRSFAIYSNRNSGTYVSNINGLNLVKKGELIKLWELDPDLTVRILDIVGVNDSTQLLCTDGYGIIVLNNNRIIQKISTETGLASPFCKKAIRIDDKFYVCTNNGLSIFSIKGNYIQIERSLSTESRFFSNDIRDVVKKGDSLYIATEKGVSIFNTNIFNENRTELVPDIYFNSVYNNQKVIDFNKNFSIPNDQRNLVVNFTAITFDQPEKILYQYKFNSGDGKWISTNLNEINFSQLEPGKYELIIRAKKPNSNWSKNLNLNFIVEKPFYLESWFLIPGSLFLFGSVFVVILYLIKRSQRNKIFELEKTNLLNSERARISADMHDDLGSDLSKIGLLAYVVKTKYSHNQNIDESLEKIYDSVNATRKKADEIIWALNPQMDTSGDLLAFLTDYCLNFFDGSNIAISINKVGVKNEIPIRSRIRRDVFLITKEICNNVLKHSKASRMNIVMKIDNGVLILEFKDDGIGFTIEDDHKNGNGLINIRKRIKGVNGDFEITSFKGNGVTYLLTIPII